MLSSRDFIHIEIDFTWQQPVFFGGSVFDRIPIDICMNQALQRHRKRSFCDRTPALSSKDGPTFSICSVQFIDFACWIHYFIYIYIYEVSMPCCASVRCNQIIRCIDGATLCMWHCLCVCLKWCPWHFGRCHVLNKTAIPIYINYILI